MASSRIRTKDSASAMVVRGKADDASDGMKITGHVYVEQWRGGELIATRTGKNMVVTTGLNLIMEKCFDSASRDVAFGDTYVGLMDDAPTSVVAGDTMVTQTNWAEATPYSDANRIEYIGDQTGESGNVTNSASTADFSINATDTVGGAFITTDNTKGGTAGTLISAVDFTGGNVSVVNGDTLKVTYTYDLDDV